MGVLMDAASDAAGGGGGGAVTPIDEKRVNDIVNGALKRFSEKELPGVLKIGLDGVTAGFTTQFTTLTETLAALKPVETTPPAKGDNKKDDELSPAVKAKFQEYEKEQKKQADLIAASDKLRIAAEAKAKATEKNSGVRAALNQFNFATPEAAEDAFTLISGKVDFNEEGQLVADGLLVDDFVKGYIPEKKPYLLASTGKGGSGASGGTNKTGKGKFDTDSIKPGMSTEMQASAVSAILDAIGRPGQ